MRRTLFAAAGIIGLIAALIVAAGGWWLAGRTQETLRRSFLVAGDGVAAARDTVALAGETLTELDAGLAALESGLTATGGAFTELPPVVTELSALAASEIPAGLTGVADSAAALADVTQGLDRALAPLRVVGVELGPVGDLTDSLREVEAGLAGVPARLRAQAARLERAASGLDAVDGDLAELAGQVRETRLGLGRATVLIERYDRTAADAAAVVADASADLDTQVLVARLLAIVLAGTIALLQVVPLSLALAPRPAGYPASGEPSNQAAVSSISSI